MKIGQERDEGVAEVSNGVVATGLGMCDRNASGECTDMRDGDGIGGGGGDEDGR